MSLQRYELSLIELDEVPECILDYVAFEKSQNGNIVLAADALKVIAELREALAGTLSTLTNSAADALFQATHRKQPGARVAVNSILARMEAIRALLARTETLTK